MEYYFQTECLEQTTFQVQSITALGTIIMLIFHPVLQALLLMLLISRRTWISMLNMDRSLTVHTSRFIVFQTMLRHGANSVHSQILIVRLLMREDGG